MPFPVRYPKEVAPVKTFDAGLMMLGVIAAEVVAVALCYWGIVALAQGLQYLGL